jgi:hypothetical protein
MESSLQRRPLTPSLHNYEIIRQEIADYDSYQILDVPALPSPPSRPRPGSPIRASFIIPDRSCRVHNTAKLSQSVALPVTSGRCGSPDRPHAVTLEDKRRYAHEFRAAIAVPPYMYPALTLRGTYRLGLSDSGKTIQKVLDGEVCTKQPLASDSSFPWYQSFSTAMCSPLAYNLK